MRSRRITFNKNEQLSEYLPFMKFVCSFCKIYSGSNGYMSESQARNSEQQPFYSLETWILISALAFSVSSSLHIQWKVRDSFLPLSQDFSSGSLDKTILLHQELSLSSSSSFITFILGTQPFCFHYSSMCLLCQHS